MTNPYVCIHVHGHNHTCTCTYNKYYEAYIMHIPQRPVLHVYIPHPLVVTIPAQTNEQSRWESGARAGACPPTLSLPQHPHTLSGRAVGGACKHISPKLLQASLPQRAVGHSGRQLVDKHLWLHQTHSLVLLRHLERAIITHVGVGGC